MMTNLEMTVKLSYVIREKFINHLLLSPRKKFATVAVEMCYVIREKLQIHLLLNHLLLLPYMIGEKFITKTLLHLLLLLRFYLILRQKDIWLMLWPPMVYRNMIFNVAGGTGELPHRCPTMPAKRSELGRILMCMMILSYRAVIMMDPLLTKLIMVNRRLTKNHSKMLLYLTEMLLLYNLKMHLHLTEILKRYRH